MKGKVTIEYEIDPAICERGGTNAPEMQMLLILRIMAAVHRDLIHEDDEDAEPALIGVQRVICEDENLLACNPCAAEYLTKGR